MLFRPSLRLGRNPTPEEVRMKEELKMANSALSSRIFTTLSPRILFRNLRGYTDVDRCNYRLGKFREIFESYEGPHREMFKTYFEFVDTEVHRDLGYRLGSS
tara:strand:+ start:1812 stop:2117 length:306 start_codon:yes stop_codon:yes gene_type:complete